MGSGAKTTTRRRLASARALVVSIGATLLTAGCGADKDCPKVREVTREPFADFIRRTFPATTFYDQGREKIECRLDRAEVLDEPDGPIGVLVGKTTQWTAGGIEEPGEIDMETDFSLVFLPTVAGWFCDDRRGFAHVRWQGHGEERTHADHCRWLYMNCRGPIDYLEQLGPP